MSAVLDRLQSLRVADVMNAHVVRLSSHQTMSAAAAVFTEHHISGAPVVDEQGRCVGILSAADFVGREQERAEGATCLAASEKSMVHRAPNGPWEIEDVYPNRVAAHMTPAVQTVAAEMSLVDAGRIMCAQHVHRLPVLDAEGHPRGMVTSLDIVAALVAAVEEQQHL